MSNTHEKVREEQVDYYLKVAQAHLSSYNIRLRIRKWKDDDDYGKIKYQLADEDESTGKWLDLSRPMTKSEVFECLYALCSLYARIEKVRWVRYMRAEEEQERQRWEENAI